MRSEKHKEIVEDIVGSVERILSSQGYTHARIRTPKDVSGRSIDILAWRGGGKRKIHLKITLDTDDVKRQEALDLIGVSKTIDSKPIIVSEYEKRFDLQDEVIYEKNNVPTVNISTLGKLLDNCRELYIISKKGDYYVRINGDALRRLRKETGMS